MKLVITENVRLLLMLMLGKWGSVYHKLVQVLQSETIFLQNRADIKRMLQNKAALRYYIVGQELLEIWAVNVTTKC